jgi:hypothetical protein
VSNYVGICLETMAKYFSTCRPIADWKVRNLLMLLMFLLGNSINIFCFYFDRQTGPRPIGYVFKQLRLRHFSSCQHFRIFVSLRMPKSVTSWPKKLFTKVLVIDCFTKGKRINYPRFVHRRNLETAVYSNGHVLLLSRFHGSESSQ